MDILYVSPILNSQTMCRRLKKAENICCSITMMNLKSHKFKLSVHLLWYFFCRIMIAINKHFNLIVYLLCQFRILRNFFSLHKFYPGAMNLTGVLLSSSIQHRQINWNLVKFPGLVVNIEDSQSEPWSSDMGSIPVFT